MHSFYVKAVIPLLFCIKQGLYLGSIATAANKPALKDCNITHILTVAGRIPPAHPNDFVYKIIDGMVIFIEIKLLFAFHVDL